MKPILPKSRYLASTIIQALKNGFPDVSPQLVLIDCDLEENEIKSKYPLFYDYLLGAMKKDNKGNRIVDRTLVKSRNPWYKQEQRSAPMFLLTYMGRQKRDLPPLYFLYNKSKAIALNTYILVYPKKWLHEILIDDEGLCKELLESLNNADFNDLLEKTRVYSGGLMKLEPGSLRETQLYNLPKKILNSYNEYQKSNA